MLESLKERLKAIYCKWSTLGMHFPFVRDPVDGKPSITLFFPYASFAIAAISVIALHFKPGLFVPTCVAIAFWSLSTVFYMIRKINKASVNLTSKSIELEGGDDKP